MENITQGHWFRGPSSDLGEPINQSLRFRAGTGSSGHLSKAITTSSSTAALTISFWCKVNPGATAGSSFVFSSGTSGGASGNIYYDGTNENIRFQDTSSYTGFTTQKLRDPSAWYHIVYRFDAANEYAKVYVNGQQHSSTAIATSARSSFGATSPMQVGIYADTSYVSNRFDGYLAEFNMLFGTSLGPDSFGRTNADGIWVPISLSNLTSNQYGALGFRHVFDSSAGLGDDSAPTGGTHASANDFTATGFDTTALKNYDSLVDTTNSGIYDNGNEGPARIFDNNSSTQYSSSGAGTLDLGDLGADLGTGVSTIVVRTYPRLGTNTVTVNSTSDSSANSNATYNQTINHDGSAITTFTVAGTDTAYWGVISITVDGTELVNTLQNDIDCSDTPTSNAITLSGIDRSTTTVVDGGNLSYSGSSTWHKARATQPYPSTGTWYYEFEAKAASGWIGAVQGNKPLNNDTIAGQSGYWVLINDGTKSINGTTSTAGKGIAAGNIIGVTYNADTDTMKWYRDNTLCLTETNVSPDTQSNLLFPLVSFYGQNTNRVNYGQYAFAYTPPDSAKGCHEFLAETEPTIKDGKDHFGVLTYTGAGNSANITGLNFQPDLVWIKNRDANDYHTLYDSVRGAGKRLITNAQDSEYTQSNSLNGFISNGFSVGGHNSVAGSGEDYVAWCWKAGTSYTPTVTGFTSPSASINTKAGFGIYKFTGNNTASSFTHGLDARPQLVIAKTLGTDDWAVFGPTSSSTALAATPTFHRFNLNDYVTKGSNVLTAVSDTTLSFGSFAETAGSSDYIYYCWHSVEGYSKVGSYYGTGNNTGKFTYCGFRPAWVMIKCINQDGNWNIYDSKRNLYNPTNQVLKSNSDGADATPGGEAIDFLANGFKCRGLDANINETYHYMYLAMAEHPFGGKEVPPATAR